MITDQLRAYYRAPVRVLVGGVPHVFWIRRFKAPAGAKYLPMPEVFFSRVDTNRDCEPGDPVGELPGKRIWDRGHNYGYLGQSFIGDPKWFETGELPAYVLTDPTPPLPETCCAPPQQGQGGAVGGGTATVIVPPVPYVGQGGAVGGGTAAGPYHGEGGAVAGGEAESGVPYQATGGAVCGGLADVVIPPAPYVGQGGAVAGGAAMVISPPTPAYSPSSFSVAGGGEVAGCDSCPDGAAYQYGFTLSTVVNAGCSDCTSLNRYWVVTYSGASGCTWIVGGFVVCGEPDQWSFSIGDTEVTLSDFAGAAGVVYTAPRAGWNCLTPITLSRMSSEFLCAGLPPTIVVSPV